MKFRQWLTEGDVYFRGVGPDYDWNSMNSGGHQQEGPGIYFSNSEKDARMYGNVMKVELNFRKTVPVQGAIPRQEIETMMRQAPDLEDVLMDWGEDPNQAFQAALQGMLQCTGPHDAFQQVWIDFYHRGNYDQEYLNNMVALGYDGVIVPKDGVVHAIVFNPQTVQVINQ